MNQGQEKSSIIQKPITITYSELMKKETNKLFPKIEEAYGKDGLGILVVEDVPDFEQKRINALTLIDKFANFTKDQLKKYEPTKNKARGWSRGIEKFNGEPDFLKGSFYSVLPKLNHSSNSNDENIWPDDTLPELKLSLIETGSEMRLVGLEILTVIDKYINSKFSHHKLDSIRKQIEVSEMCISRGLYYFPKIELDNKDLLKDNIWCDWHNDHGSLTALCSSLYFDKHVKQENMILTKTGLYIKNRKGEDVKVTYKGNSIAFQIGETIQVQSGGILHATPHSVMVGDDIDKNVGRSNFVLFMQPNLNEIIDIPEGSNFENVKTDSIYDVKIPKIENRFEKGMTFEKFHNNTLNYFEKKKN